MTFQNYALYPYMDVYNNMAFWPGIAEISQERDRPESAESGRDFRD